MPFFKLTKSFTQLLVFFRFCSCLTFMGYFWICFGHPLFGSFALPACKLHHNAPVFLTNEPGPKLFLFRAV